MAGFVDRDEWGISLCQASSRDGLWRPRAMWSWSPARASGNTAKRMARGAKGLCVSTTCIHVQHRRKRAPRVCMLMLRARTWGQASHSCPSDKKAARRGLPADGPTFDNLLDDPFRRRSRRRPWTRHSEQAPGERTFFQSVARNELCFLAPIWTRFNVFPHRIMWGMRIPPVRLVAARVNPIPGPSLSAMDMLVKKICQTRIRHKRPLACHRATCLLRSQSVSQNLGNNCI